MDKIILQNRYNKLHFKKKNMETHLTIKHLAGYLPYELKGFNQNNRIVYFTLADGRYLLDRNFKPILRPLSDLTKEIEVNEEKLVPIEEICKIHQLEFVDGLFNDYVSNSFSYEWLPYAVIQKLLEWHFDIYGLIEAGLAIDINKI